MSLAEAGAYIRLISVCWLDGSLPGETKLLARLCGATSRQMLEMWPAIGRCFHPTSDGRLTHPRLDKEREKQAVFSRRQTDAADARWKKSKSDTTALPRHTSGIVPASPPAMPNACSAVSDLQSASPEKKKLPSDLDTRWEEFKGKYPGKGRDQSYASLQAFMAGCESVGVDVVMAGVERYAKSENVRKGFVTGMRKWLEDGLWIREPDVPEEQAAASHQKAREYLAQIDAERAARGR